MLLTSTAAQQEKKSNFLEISVHLTLQQCTNSEISQSLLNTNSSTVSKIQETNQMETLLNLKIYMILICQPKRDLHGKTNMPNFCCFCLQSSQ